MLKRLSACFFVLMFLVPCAARAETYEVAQVWPSSPEEWSFLYPEGVATDSEGYVYVVDTGNHRVKKYFPLGRLCNAWGGFGTGEREFNDPSGIAIDDEDNVYVADNGNKRIQKFTSTGEFLTQWPIYQGIPPWPMDPVPIAWHQDGFLLLVDYFADEVQRFTKDGQPIPQDTFPYEGIGTGIAVDSQGNIYLSERESSQIRKYDQQGVLLDAWGSPGSGPLEFDYPAGLAFDSTGSLYVVDRRNNRIQQLGADGGFISQWKNDGFVNGSLSDPMGVAVGADDTVYVSDRSNHRILRFPPDAKAANKWAVNGTSDGFFRWPMQTAIGPDGNIYCSDYLNDRVQVFSPEGVHEFTLGGEKGSGEGQFNGPVGVCVSGAGEIFVVDSENHRVQKFSSSGEFKKSWGSFGSGEKEFKTPYDCAVSETGNVYVTDMLNHRVQEFSGEGEFLFQWGEEGPDIEEFDAPRGIDVGSDGRIYVADTANHRIQVFEADHTFVGILGTGTKGDGPGEFNRPYGVTTDQAGRVFVADNENHRVQVFSGSWEFEGEMGGFGSGTGYLNRPYDAAVNGDGDIFVTDLGNNRIQVFHPAANALQDKAVIIAGGGAGDENSIWEATSGTAGLFYRTLLFQGFKKENIRYFSPVTHQDLDNDGRFNDIYAEPTLAGLETTLTQWAGDAENLLVFLIDHGRVGSFDINKNVSLPTSDLRNWIDQAQSTLPGYLLLVIDACHSGSFLPELINSDYPNRYLVTSAAGDEPAYMVEGTISFSGFFWTQIFQGQTVKNAFRIAERGLRHTFSGRNQTPQIEANGNAIANEDEDLAIVEQLRIGRGIATASTLPEIENVIPTTQLAGEKTLKLWAEGVIASTARNDVFAMIIPPDVPLRDSDFPVASLPILPLIENGDRYEGVYDGFAEPGTYHIAFYAEDEQGFLSLPQTTEVVQAAGAHEFPRSGIWSSRDQSVKFFLQTYETDSSFLVLLHEGSLTALLDQDVTDASYVFRSYAGPPTTLVFEFGDSTEAGKVHLQTEKGFETYEVTLLFAETSETGPYLPPNGIWRSPEQDVNLYLQRYEAGSAVLVTLVGDTLSAFLDPVVGDGIGADQDIFERAYSVNFGLSAQTQGMGTFVLPGFQGVRTLDLAFEADSDTPS